MSRPSRDAWALGMAQLTASRATCARLAVGCVLLDTRGRVLSTGYNGRAAGLPNCTDVATVLGPREPTSNPFWREQGGERFERPYVETHPHRCPNSTGGSGQPNGCEAIHAEQNALLQCRDVDAVATCYVTHSPCWACTKLLLNTGCRRVVFAEAYPHPEARALWEGAGRAWEQLTL